MTRSMPVIAFAVAALGLGVLESRAAAAAEEATIKAFSTWHAGGQVSETGPKEAVFVGVLAGTVYVETEKGPLESGQMVCPAMVTIDLTDGSQTGNGRCTITDKEGARVYAEIACEGVHLIGCDGEFKLTGGTGRFEGISGGGPVVIRSDFRKLGADAGSTFGQATGIMYWRELSYRIP